MNNLTCDCCLSLVQIVGRILHLGARSSHTQRPPPQPATLCLPQPGPTQQRAQQPALPRSTTDTPRSLVSQPNFRAISSPRSQTASATPRLLLCSALAPSLNTRCDVQKRGGAAGGFSCCCCFNGSCKGSSCSSPLVSNSTIKRFSVLNCCCCCSCC